MMFQQPNQH